MKQLMLGHRGQTSRLDGPVRTPVGWTVRPCATAQRPAVRHSRAIADPTLPSDRRTPAMSDRTGKTDGRSRDHASAVHIPKATGPSILLCLLAACIQIPAPQHPAPKAGPGIAVSSGTVSVDASKVPVVTGTCRAGDVVSRSGSGWGCEPPTPGPKGDTGETGPQGPAGGSVASEPVSEGDSHCPFGGTKLTAGGADTYVCNGAPGQKGAQGSQGPQGNPGDQGPPGASVVATPLDAGDSHCAYGGSQFVTGQVTTYACNGAPGPQGDAGTPCDASAIADMQNTLTTLQGTAAALQTTIASQETRLATLEANLCPPGWSATTVSEPNFKGPICTKQVSGSTDEMVKVGDYWIDRFEMSTCGSGSMGDASGNGYGTTAVGCSVSGVMPTTSITWFQAAQMCANAGKTLCTNQEWQIAVSGTPDPGASDGSGGACNTQSNGPRNTGLGTNCRSTFGAEDMIGNLWEWTSDWHQAGVLWMTSDGQSATPWPSGYGSDATWNINGRTSSNPAPYTDGLPAAGVRGGSCACGSMAGAFSVLWRDAPSGKMWDRGARCCIGGE